MMICIIYGFIFLILLIYLFTCGQFNNIKNNSIKVRFANFTQGRWWMQAQKNSTLIHAIRESGKLFVYNLEMRVLACCMHEMEA